MAMVPEELLSYFAASSGNVHTLVAVPDLRREGGVSNYYATLRKHLPANVVYFTMGPRTTDKAGLARVIRVMRDTRQLNRILSRHEYDIVHLNPSLIYGAVIREGVFLHAAKRWGRKVVVFIRGWHRSFEQELHHWKLALFKAVYFQADAMVVLAKEFEAKLRTWGYRGPIYVESTAVDDELLSNFGLRERLMANQRAGVLFMSRVVRSKGIYEALDAYDQVRRTWPEMRFTVAGDGEELQAVRKYVADKVIAGVDFVGYVRGDEKARILQTHDIFLLPTCHGEGMPNSILEAMAAGLPIVTRPVGGLRDFFLHGKMGYATKDTSPKVFAEYVNRLVSNPELSRSMGQFNHMYAKEHFAASSVAKRLNDIYHAVMQNRTGKSA